MFDWTSIVNWKLLPGSHNFPGPDGGTCINEAAVVAAGFEYRKIAHAEDCPPCFSRVLSAYLLRLNDVMPEAERQELMRFVLRLGGSADTPEIERQRAGLIVLRTVQRALPPILRASGKLCEAIACEAANTLREAKTATACAVIDLAAAPIVAPANFAVLTASIPHVTPINLTYDDQYHAIDIWPIAIAIAEEAFGIGNQATPQDTALIVKRMELAKL